MSSIFKLIYSKLVQIFNPTTPKPLIIPRAKKILTCSQDPLKFNYSVLKSRSNKRNGSI